MGNRGKRNETELWADEVINRIRNKMARVSEKTGIRSPIPQMKTEIMMTVPTGTALGGSTMA